MRQKSLFSVLGVFFMLLLSFSCSSEEQVPNEDNKSEVAFELAFPEQLTKADPAFKTPCYDLAQLQTLANAGNLNLDFTLGSTNYSVKIKYVNNKFIADPVSLALGTYAINSFIVKDNLGNTLYAAPMTGSAMAAYVPAGFTLPFNLVLGQSDLYQKVTKPIWVVCAQHLTPSEFGYVMWDINFMKMLCLPFSVNVCDRNGVHAIGTGTLKIYKDGDFTDAAFTASGSTLLSTTTFPNGATLAEFCIPDILSVDNNKEFYKYEISTTNNGVAATYTGTANVATLLNYAASSGGAWDAAKNYLHFDFCNCNPKWFFECGSEVVCNQNAIIDIYSGIGNLLSFNSVVQTKLTAGSFVDGFAGLITVGSGLAIPAGTVIRIKAPVKMNTGIKMFANIGYLQVALNTTISSPVYRVNIYSDNFITKYKTLTDQYNLFNNYNSQWSTDSPICIDEQANCYYYEFEFLKAIPVLTRLSIEIAPNNECPKQHIDIAL
ncbi:MAG: hypothetical protein ACRCX4_13575 [Bacteroidales bacterium]